MIPWTCGRNPAALSSNPVPGKEYPLSELLKAITPENLHDEVDFGRPVGKEAW
jgi:antitoxin MazE